MGARKHKCCYPLDVTKPGAVVVRVVQSETAEEYERRGRGLARMLGRQLAKAAK